MSHRGVHAQSSSPGLEPARRDAGGGGGRQWVGEGGRIVSSRKLSFYERSHAS